MLERLNSGETGRPVDALLADYAAGRLSRPLHGLVAAHLAIKPDNRKFVAALEAAQARAVETIAPQALANRDAMLEKIFAAKASPSVPLADDVIPAPLLALAGAGVAGSGFAGLNWKSRLPGLKEFQIKDKAVGEAVFYWIKPGRKMPSHTHEGTEVTLVLKGGFSDAYGHYRRGDIAIADGDINHTPRADDDEDCICFAVTDAPLRLTGPLGRMLRIFTHH